MNVVGHVFADLDGALTPANQRQDGGYRCQ
jgi:hypothetical protein